MHSSLTIISLHSYGSFNSKISLKKCALFTCRAVPHARSLSTSAMGKLITHGTEDRGGEARSEPWPGLSRDCPVAHWWIMRRELRQICWLFVTVVGPCIETSLGVGIGCLTCWQGWLLITREGEHTTPLPARHGYNYPHFLIFRITIECIIYNLLDAF